jgi:hypothetical protein
MLKRVSTIRTQYTAQEMVNAFVEAWCSISGSVPKKEQIGVIFGQWALETGMSASMYNNNIGNVKAPKNPSEEVEYCVLHNVWEIIDGKKVILSPEDPGSWFRSFPTLLDGVKFHFNFLKNKRYKIAWQAVEAGDPADFSKKLRQQGYYTAPEDHYTKAIMSYFNKFKASNYFENAINKLDEKINPKPVVVGKVQTSVSVGTRELNEEYLKSNDSAIKLSASQKLYNFFDQKIKSISEKLKK